MLRLIYCFVILKEVSELKCYNENLQEDWTNKNHKKTNFFSLIPKSLGIHLKSLMQGKAL